jgi:transposase
MAVQEITLDLANSMDWICRASFPAAIHTADRFHFQKIISEAVQEIRIKHRRNAIDEENEKMAMARKEKAHYVPEIYKNGDTKKQLLARSRHLLFKTQSNWTISQSKRAQILFKIFPEIQKAYELSLYFRGIFERKITKK